MTLNKRIYSHLLYLCMERIEVYFRADELREISLGKKVDSIEVLEAICEELNWSYQDTNGMSPFLFLMATQKILLLPCIWEEMHLKRHF